MAVSTTTDSMTNQTPVSPVFIDFIAHWLDKSAFSNERWPDQLSEELVNSRADMKSKARWRLDRIMSDDAGQAIVENVYRRFYDLGAGFLDTLDSVHKRHSFLVVVGIPRTGGSYLTAELFSALGYEPTDVPAAVAHDGFPDARPVSISSGENTLTTTMLSISEYFSIVELFFSKVTTGNRVHVPKKLTKGAYAGGLFNAVLGKDAEYFLTIRHPIAACISTYEKSGGLPADGNFKARSTIEKWIRRDLQFTGISPAEMDGMDYFMAYVRYWEQYYINLAMSGLTTGRTRTVIPFSRQRMEETVNSWHGRFESCRKPTEFVSSERLYERHPQWVRRSDEALERVAAVWRLVGLPFPTAELAQCS